MIAWFLTGLMTVPTPARVEIRYETQPSGFHGHWTLEDVRSGTLPGLAVRGPMNQEQLLVIELSHTDEAALRFDVQVLEDQVTDGMVTPTAILSPSLITTWDQEAVVFTSDRMRLKRFGRNRWADIQVKLSLTAWPQTPTESEAVDVDPMSPPADEPPPPQ
jgi:hypothetical protein